MIMICKQKCYFLDRSIKPGQSIDIPENLVKTDLVRSSFTTPASAEQAKQAEVAADSDKAKTELTATEIKRRLDEMGIPYKGNASRDALQNILNAQIEARAGQAD